MIIVLFGQPHSGKTTLAERLEFENLYDIHIDGDKLREVFNNKDFSREGRLINLQKASDIAAFLNGMSYDVVMSVVYPYKEARDYLNNLVPNVKWIYLTYTNPRGREDFHVADFEEPELENFMQINTDNQSIEETLEKIEKYVGQKSTR
jgi:adenylylsulfate kinase-like enzyme